MIAIQKSHKHHGKCVPNVLPCRVNHNGQAVVSKRFWAPNKSEDGKIVSYFRGRQLHGRAVDIPEGYKGVVLSATDTSRASEVQSGHHPCENEDQDEDQDEDAAGEDQDKDAAGEGILEEMADFDEFMIWGHEALPDETADPYIRGIEEWIEFADVIHIVGSETGKK